jgi:hypothetical protein
MVAAISAVSLLAAVCLTSVSASIVPGAFIFEFEENAVRRTRLTLLTVLITLLGALTCGREGKRTKIRL